MKNFGTALLILYMTLLTTSVLAQSAEEVVQKQVEAYNNQDLDAFMSYYTGDVQIYTFPDSLTMSGQEEMRERYRKLFESSPDLHAEIQKRITFGDYVIDHERVTGFGGDGTVQAIAVYKLRGDKIEKVWFIM